MARRRKTIVDLVRDGTFLARKDEHLLGRGDPLPWRELEKLRQRYRAATGDERRAVSLELERGLREHPPSRWLGDLQTELAKLGPRGSYQQLAKFAAKYFRHYAGPAAGKPFRFARFQHDFLTEFMRRDKHGRRVYQVGVLMIPKGNGKTPLASVVGTHALVCNTDAPEVYNIAGAKDQAGHCYEFARQNIEDGALAAWLEPGSGVIRCDEHRGAMEVLSSDGDLAAGIKPTAFVVDEWWLYMHRKQREGWNSGVQALHKRPGEAFALAISTAGYSKTTQLGETYDAAMAHPQVERLNGGFLHVLRDADSGFLFWAYGVPEDLEVDYEDVRMLRAVNPAPFVFPRDLVKELRRPDTNELAWFRLHCNGWTDTKDSWLPFGRWRQLRSDHEIPRGADVFVAIDAAQKHDTTAVAIAHRLEDGRVALRARVWTARPEAPHHVYVPGGLLDNELVETYLIEEVAKRYNVREIVGDPRFLVDLLPRLSRAGFVVAEYAQNSGAMADAYQHFYGATVAGTITHDGDPVFTQHVEAAAAVLTERGWKVWKLQSWSPIDALVAACMARERCARAGQSPSPAKPWSAKW